MIEKVIGRAKGGVARMAGVPKRERRALALKAAAARWSGDIKEATHGSDDHPLRIGDIEIPCYVLEDGRHHSGRYDERPRYEARYGWQRGR
jgi:hypothetical protein